MLIEKEVLKLLKIHHYTLKKIVQKLKIEPVRISRFRFYTDEQIEKIKEEHKKISKPRRNHPTTPKP